MPYYTVRTLPDYDFGPGAMNLTVDIPSGLLCEQQRDAPPGNFWLADWRKLPAYAHHDAEYRGVRLTRSDVIFAPSAAVAALAIATLATPRIAETMRNLDRKRQAGNFDAGQAAGYFANNVRDAMRGSGDKFTGASRDTTAATLANYYLTQHAAPATD